MSADPGVGKPKPVPVDKDHIGICKPSSREDIVYLGVKRHIQRVVKTVEPTSPETIGAIGVDDYEKRSTEDRRDLLQKLLDAGREHEYSYANDAQNRFARRYTKTGLFTAAREDHDNLLSEIETRFVTHVYHPFICRSASDHDTKSALQEKVIDSLVFKEDWRDQI